MEKRIERKIETFMSSYKEDIKNKAVELGIIELGAINQNNNVDKLIQFIFDKENIQLTKEDFMKRKRSKNFVNNYERCCAKRANGESCSRRKKQGCEYCGTHIKGTPHGIVMQNIQEPLLTKVEVHAQDIQGIIYYIDNNDNVYQVEDIIKNVENPKVIAKYVKTNDQYHIPSFGI
jgi:hypothetical protein